MTATDVSPGVADRSVRAVVAVVEAGSFTGAALTLGIGQSAVSHAVARLEQALGVALFIRKRDGVEPTTVGAALAARAAPALRELDAAVAAAA
ncbi:MAG: LysR family transcriptional regulator, partial [Acidimicrobiaceae bacterium]|nr:LysR family transcriptional regulator [Acidimicrobiaceae bacterium]